MATKEESIFSVAQVAAKVAQLEPIATAWSKTTRTERLPQPSDKEAASTPMTQLKVNGSPARHTSPGHHDAPTQTRASSASESDYEALLRRYAPSTHPSRAEAMDTHVSDTDDS